MIKEAEITLRALTAKDLEIFRKWVNDPQISRGLLRHLPVADFEHRAWFKRLKHDKNQLYFGIVINKGQIYIGNVGLKNIDWKNKNGDFFIYIGNKKYWGKGYATLATKLFCNYCFNVLNLHKICLRVAQFNVAAIKAYKKAGFTTEGLLKEEYFSDGRYYDIIRMGLVNK